MKKAYLILAAINLFFQNHTFSQNQPTDPLSNRSAFGNVQDGPLYKALALLDKDSINRSLATKCILGTSFEELQIKNVPDLEARIEKLVASGVLKLSDGKYYLSFPVILGKKRELLYDLGWKKAMTLLPGAEPAFEKLAKELGNRQDVAFHIFWSRIIHDVYIQLWHKYFPDEMSDPAEIWLVYPRHPFMVGSRFYEIDRKAQLEVSWNNHCMQNLQSIEGLKNILYSDALNNAISNRDNTLLKKFGFSNESGNYRVFSYKSGDKLDKQCENIVQELLPAFTSLYDYKSLARTFEISEKDIFLIVLHETIFSLFENMQQLNKLEFPAALRNDSSSTALVQLVSLKLYDNH